MKSFLFCFLFTISHTISAQTNLKGKLIDAETSSPLSYVNIGVIGKNVGTVSAFDGSFGLSVASKYDSDLMRISMVGYESIELKVSELASLLIKNEVLTMLQSKNMIEEIVISSAKLKSKKVGNLNYSDNVHAAFGTDTLGNEMGILIKIKKRPTIIKNFSFPIGRNNNGHIKFRLNIYNMKGGRPQENLLNENIIIETDIEKGLVTTDLTPYHIVVQDDFLISLEWIEKYNYDELNFSASFFSKPVWSRSTSQGRWLRIPIIGIGLSATILY